MPLTAVGFSVSEVPFESASPPAPPPLPPPAAAVAAASPPNVLDFSCAFFFPSSCAAHHHPPFPVVPIELRTSAAHHLAMSVFPSAPLPADLRLPASPPSPLLIYLQGLAAASGGALSTTTTGALQNTNSPAWRESFTGSGGLRFAASPVASTGFFLQGGGRVRVFDGDAWVQPVSRPRSDSRLQNWVRESEGWNRCRIVMMRCLSGRPGENTAAAAAVPYRSAPTSTA